MEMNDVRKYVAELIGTFALVFIGCGSAVIAGTKTFEITGGGGNVVVNTLTMGGQIGLLGISLAFGLTVLVMVYAIGHISGCHINPAITLSMLVAGKIKSKDAVFYIIMQCVGAVVAAGALYAIASGQDGYSLSVNGLGQNGYENLSPGGYSLVSCFVAEVVLTALFLFVIFGVTSKGAPKGFAGIPIGFSLVIIHLIGIPITGTSVNPARSLGPALMVGGETLGQLWLFLIAPLVGGILAAVLWKYVFEEKKKEK